MTGCSSSHSATTPTVLPVTGPVGYDCFAIMDGERVAGGNCVRQ